jgi:SAM-dependent methyltransferase
MTASIQDTDPYTFDNNKDTGAPLLDHLSVMLDPFSRGQLLKAGVRPGARCLELGAGAGTIAAWMADQVGPDGLVIATDIKPQHIVDHPGIQVVHHNLLVDPLPESKDGWNVIHARLVLAHLPSREQLVATLTGALAPGGALVLEEWKGSWDECVLSSPDSAAQELFTRYHVAFQSVLTSRGNDVRWAQRVNSVMRGAGLVDVETTVHARSWPGGSAGCQLPIATTTEIQDALIANGLSREDLERMWELLRDPRLVIRDNLMFSTIGRKA